MTATMGLRGPGAEHPHHRAGRGGHTPLHRRPLLGAGPPRQPRRGRGRQPRHRRQHLPGRVRALPIQPNQEILPRQLRRHDPDQQLTPRNPRSRALIGPTAASNAATTPNRSTNSVTATNPAFFVNHGSAAPTRTLDTPPRRPLGRPRPPRRPRILFTR